MYRKKWVVYSKPPFGGPDQVLKYLARYTHRVAISNHRLVSLQDGNVTFRWKNYAQGDRCQTMSLSGFEFLRRFLLHVLPGGFVRIRHYGLMANRHRQQKLALCRRLLNVNETPEVDTSDGTDSQTEGGECEKDRDNGCPYCQKGRMRTVDRTVRPTIPELLKQPWPWNTS